MREPARSRTTSTPQGNGAHDTVHGLLLTSRPCVGCGWCCIDNQCGVSHGLHGYVPRCPELLWDASCDRYVCRLIRDAPPEVDLTELHAGEGCCAPLHGWHHDVRQRT